MDSRTDIYALGLIVYEMVTGQRAFAKGSQAGLIAAILTETPPPMTGLQPRTPAALERIILIALEKDPNRRWQDAGDLARELSWLTAGSHTTTVGAVARTPAAWRPWMLAAAAVVLAAIGTTGLVWGPKVRNPLRNPQSSIRSLVILPCRGSADAITQAYCDGLTDTLSARLTPLAVSRGLQMTSTLDVRQRGVSDAAKARREFGATLILEGGILRSGETLRVNYVLVDAVTLRQIDAFSVTTAAGDPFALQDQVFTWAAGVLLLNLKTGERQTLAKAGTRVPGALDLYLEGRGYALDYQKPGNIDAAIDRFTRAIARDPLFPAAHAGLGGALWLKYEASRETAIVAQARSACAEALRLDPTSPAAHVCAGTVALGSGRFDEAVAAFQLAIDRDPTSDEGTLGLARAQARGGAADAAERTYARAIALRPTYWATHVWLGTFYRQRSRYADAAREYELAATLTPDNARVYYILGGLYGSIGRYEDAIAACRRSAALVPSWDAYNNWGMTLYRLRRFGEAVEKLEAARKVGPDSYQLVGNLARAEYYAGRRLEAQARYRDAIALGERALGVNPRDEDTNVSVAGFYSKLGDRDRAVARVGALPAELSDPHVMLFAAFVFADLGDPTTALAWLERATRRGLAFNELTEWIDLDPLRSDPRFAALTAK